MSTSIEARFVIEAHSAFCHENPTGLLFIANQIREDDPLFGPIKPNTEFTFAEAFCLWVYALLVGRKRFDRDTVLLMLQLKGKELRQLGNDIYEAIDWLADSPRDAVSRILAIADNRYIHFPWAVEDTYYDVTTGETVYTIPPTFEGTTYNLALLALRNWMRVKEAQNGANQTAEADVAGSENVGDTAASNDTGPART